MQSRHTLFYVLSTLLFTFTANVTATNTTLPQHNTHLTAQHIAPSGQIWNLQNADIRAVIQTVSAVTGKSFIVSPGVAGKVTLVSHTAMRPAELYQVFLSLLRTLNYAAISQSDGVVKIVPTNQVAGASSFLATPQHPGQGAQIVVRIVPIIHVPATQLLSALNPLVGNGGNITLYAPTNSLILSGTADDVTHLLQIIHHMDNVNIPSISVYPLQHASASQLVAMIQKLQKNDNTPSMLSDIKLVADTQNNTILISANANGQLMVRHLIRQLDQNNANTENTRVISLNYLSAKKIAPILQKIATGAQQQKQNGKDTTITPNSNISIEADNNSNALIIHAPNATMQDLLQVIHKLDKKPKQVLVEAIIVKVSEGLLNKLGIVWGTASAGSSANGGIQSAGAISSDNTLALRMSGSIGFLPEDNLVAVLHALKSNSEANVLATPSVMVLNNEQASIDDGENIGVANYSYQGTTNPSNSNIITPYNVIERKDVTLSLQVTPHISPNQMIRLSLLQKNDTVAPSGDDSSSDNPTLDTSKIKTSVLVKSGNILVLGGLMNNTQEKQVEKIPILGDIPLLGYLFRYTTHDSQKSSLLVFIRPIIMSAQVARTETETKYHAARKAQLDMRYHHAIDMRSPLLAPMNTLPTVALPAPKTTQPQ